MIGGIGGVLEKDVHKFYQQSVFKQVDDFIFILSFRWKTQRRIFKTLRKIQKNATGANLEGQITLFDLKEGKKSKTKGIRFLKRQSKGAGLVG